MTHAIEARSLAFLTTLASDPPLYPRNPTQTPNARLILYIVRVPGSKDVFLTPLKPREKVVSAQDVQSSLYFLHFDDLEHDDLSESEAQEANVYASVHSGQLDNIQKSQISRKPLPTPPISPTEGFGFVTEQIKTPFFDGAERLGVPPRKPVGSDHHSRSNVLDLPSIPPRLPRRPLAGRENEHAEDLSEAVTHSRPKRPLSSQTLGHREACQPPSKANGSIYDHRDSSDFTYPGRRSIEADAEQDAGTSLTLIRRDPTSGAQWNVARIRDPPVQEISSESLPNLGTHKSKKAGAPLFVEVSNPGYTKFVHFDQTRPVSRNSTSTSSTEPEPSSVVADGVFRRRLWMDGSKFADHSYGHRKLPSLGSNLALPRSSLHLGRDDLQPTSRAFVDRRSKCYSFRSPWGGKCEFVTGTAGRSLKCKHSLDNVQSAPADVSELRFNLPNSKTFLPATKGPTETRKSSYNSRPSPHRHSSSDDFGNQGTRTSADLSGYFDKDGNIDLSLGQERAGGGFQGKQAKLGKLIIEDEGYKMLDLVVAANMALWWRAYGRE